MLRCGVWKVIALVLDALSASLFVLNHVNTLFNSVLMLIVSVCGCRLVSRVVSSAYVMNLNEFVLLEMSLMYIRKNRGPRIEP